MKMKTTYRHLAAAFTVIAAVSCAKQEISEPDQEQAQGNTYEYVLNVSQEGTKTTMDGLSILWNKEDQIAVLLQDAEGGVKNGSASKSGAQSIADAENYTPSTQATFNLQIPEGCTPIAVVYPYDSACSMEDEKKNQVAPLEGNLAARFFIPSTQIGVKDGLPVQIKNDATVSAFPMVGQIEDGKCYMHNAGALIKFEIKREDIVSLEFAGNKGEPISGRNYYYIETGEFKRSTGDSKTAVTLTPSGDVFEPGTYYFAVAPMTLSKGFTITLTNTLGQQATRKTTTEFVIQRNHKYTNFGSDEGWFSNIQTGTAGNLGSATGTTATLYGIAPDTMEEGDTYGFQISSDEQKWTDFTGEITDRFFTAPSKPVNVYTATLKEIVPETPMYFRAYYTKANGITTYGKSYSFMTFANGESAVIDLYSGWQTEYWPFTNIERNDPAQITEDSGINTGTGSDALWKNKVLTLQTKSNHTFEILATNGLWLGRSNGCLTMKATLGNYIKFPVIAGKKPVKVIMVVGNLQTPEDIESSNNSMGAPSIRKVDSETDAVGGGIAPKPRHQYHIQVWNLNNTDSDQYEMFFNTTYSKGLNCYISYLEVVYADAGSKPAKIEQNLLISTRFGESGGTSAWPFVQPRKTPDKLQPGIVGPYSTADHPEIEYNFYIQGLPTADSSSDNFRYTTGQGLRYGGTVGDYLSFPALEDYRLTYIKIRGGNQSVYYSVKDSSGTVTTGGEERNISSAYDSITEFNLTETSVNTEYRLVLGTTKQSAIREMWITYELVK